MVTRKKKASSKSAKPAPFVWPIENPTTFIFKSDFTPFVRTLLLVELILVAFVVALTVILLIGHLLSG